MTSKKQQHVCTVYMKMKHNIGTSFHSNESKRRWPENSIPFVWLSAAHHHGVATNYCGSCLCDLHCITWTEQRCQLAPHVPKVVLLLKVSKIGREILRIAVQRHTMKAYRGIRCIAPLILNLGIGWKSAVNCMPRPLYHRNPLNRRLGGARGRSGRFGKRKPLEPFGIRTADWLDPSLVPKLWRVQIRYFSSAQLLPFENQMELFASIDRDLWCYQDWF
jgi:hypothetical protein